jgi:hypothetical protein
MPRSLVFSYILDQRRWPGSKLYGALRLHDQAEETRERLKNGNMEEIFQSGLHEFLQDFILANNAVVARHCHDLQFSIDADAPQDPHETHYDYDTAAPSYRRSACYLWPVDFAAQKTLSWRIDAPGIETAPAYLDGFGNHVHIVTVGEATGGPVSIVGRRHVEVSDAAAWCAGSPARFRMRSSCARPSHVASARSASHGGKASMPANRCSSGLHALMGRCP